MTKKVLENLPNISSYSTAESYIRAQHKKFGGDVIGAVPMQTNGKNREKKYMYLWGCGDISFHYDNAGISGSKAGKLITLYPNGDMDLHATHTSGTASLADYFVNLLTSHSVRTFMHGAHIAKSMASEYVVSRAREEMDAEKYNACEYLTFILNYPARLTHDGTGYRVNPVLQTYDRRRDAKLTAEGNKLLVDFFKAAKIYLKIPMDRKTIDAHISSFNKHHHSIELTSPVEALVKFPSNRVYWPSVIATFHRRMRSNGWSETSYEFDMNEAKSTLRARMAVITGAVYKSSNPYGHVSKRYSLDTKVDTSTIT